MKLTNLKLFTRFRPKRDKSLPFIIFVFFLVTFIASRLIVTFSPGVYLFGTKNGNHVHHLVYGIIVLSVVGYITLVSKLSDKNRLRFAALYGIGLGLAYDEFAMWLELEDIYHDRRSYDAVLIIALFLLNIIYFSDFWKRWGKRLDQLFRIMFITGPKGIFKAFVQLFKD